MKEEILLGVDAGTSSIKIAAFTPDGKKVAGSARPVALIPGDGGGADLDAERYLNLCLEMLQELCSRREFAVIGIGLSTTCPVTICLDRNLEPLGPGIPYMDNRAESQLTPWRGSSVFERTGNRVSVSTCSAASALWFRDEQPGLWKKTAFLSTLSSFLAAKLTGEAAVDWTQASYSGLFRLSGGDSWDDDLVALSGIPPKKLLPVAAPWEKIGGVTAGISRLTGLPEDCPVAIGSADTAAAAFALGKKLNRSAFESAGTSGVLTFSLDSPDFSPLFMNRRHIVPGKWLAHGAVSLTGGALEWLRSSVLTEYTSIEELDGALSASRPGAGGVVFLPYLSGERCPVWDSRAKGVWYGMTLNTGRADLIESVYESAAYSLKQIMEEAAALWKLDIDTLRAVGNGTKGHAWNQMKADVLRLKYRPLGCSDASAFGAAMLGGIASGVFSGPLDPALPAIPDSGEIYSPCSDEESLPYMESYGTFVSLYPKLKGLY